MTDEPTTKARPSTPQESSTLSAPSSSIKLGDPKHRDIGDRDDESARKSGHSKGTDCDSTVESSSGKQSKQSQPSQKSAPMKSGESSGSECCGSSAESQAKPGSSSSKK